MWKPVVTASLAILVSAIGLANVASAVEVVDGCDGSDDIDTLSATYDADADEVTVVMLICAEADDRTKYRVHFDHSAPFFDDADRNGDETVDVTDVCFTTSDDTMKHKSRKDTGPGDIVVDGDTLTFTVAVDDLDPGLLLGDPVFIWADTQDKKIRDRAPNTDADDGCAKPEVESEVLALTLSPPDKTVFVTSTSHRGDFGGLAGADAVCQARADTAGLGGTYLAWLADDTGSPATRFTQSTVPYVRTDGVKVADDWNDLLDCSNPTCLQAPINLNEAGGASAVFTWTNVSISAGGTANRTDALFHCSRWSTTSNSLFGLNGRTSDTSSSWSVFGAGAGCSFQAALYCFEQ